MDIKLHPNARTTPAIGRELQAFTETTAVLARRYGLFRLTVLDGTFSKGQTYNQFPFGRRVSSWVKVERHCLAVRAHGFRRQSVKLRAAAKLTHAR